VIAYADRLAKSPLRGATPRTYLSAVRTFLAWLADGDHDGNLSMTRPRVTGQ
jgi:hypothetical protein